MDEFDEIAGRNANFAHAVNEKYRAHIERRDELIRGWDRPEEAQWIAEQEGHWPEEP